MKNKIFVLILSIFVLLPFSVNAAELNQNYQLISVGGYEVPTFWSINAGVDKSLTIDYTTIPNITPDYTLDPYLIFEICTNGPMTDIYMTKYNNNSFFSTTDIVKYNTKKSCTTLNNYSGTLWYLQLRVDKWNHVQSSDGYEVMCNLHIKNTWNYNTVYSFNNVFTSSEDYLSSYENQQKLENALGSIGDKQDQTNDKIDKIDDTLNGEDSDITNKKCGVVCKLKGIFTGIVELPGKLISGLIDGIKGLFVPTDDQLYEIVNDSKDLTENFGFIGESMNFFINIFTTLLGLVNANGCVELPEFTIGATSLFDSFTFWEARNVCLADNVVLSENINTIRSFTSIVLVAMFVSFAASKFSTILSKQSSENSYQNEVIDATSKTKWI